MDSKRGLLVTVLLIGGSLVLFLGIQINTELPLEQRNPTWSTAAGSLFFITGLLIYHNQNTYLWFERAVDRLAAWFEVSPWQVLLLVLAPLFALLGSAGAGYGKSMYSPVYAVLSWLLGIALILSGGYKQGENKPVISKQTLLFATGIASLAFLFRGIGTGQFPILLTGDEGSAGLIAREFVSGDRNNIFISGWFSFPTFFSYIQSLSIRNLGQTIEALRIPSAVAGSLTVAAVYFCGKAMFGERTGRYSALALAALHFHIHFSRLGLNNIWDGLGFTLTLGAIWYGWTRDSRFAYQIGGLALGFSQFFYATSRGLFAVLITGLALAFLIQRARFYRSVPNLVLSFAISIAILFPLIRYYISEPNQFLAPITRASSIKSQSDLSAREIAGQLARGLQGYTVANLQNWYKPDTPILRPILSTLFYFGIIFLLFDHRDSRLILLTLWLVLFGLIGGLSESPPAAQRYVAAAPACALVIGLGLHRTIGVFENIWSNRIKGAALLGYTVILLAMASDLTFYFRDYRLMEKRNNIASNGMVAQELANFLGEKPEGTLVIFMNNPRMGYYSIPSIQYLAPQVIGIDATPDWAINAREEFTGERMVFVFLAENEDEIEIVRESCPGGLLLSKNTPDGQTLFWLYEYVAN